MTVTILYATQTGNSRRIADIVYKACIYGYNEQTLYNTTTKARNKSSYECMSMEEFDHTQIHTYKTIVFVCSTHGDGDEPFCMRNMWAYLKQKHLDKDYLQNLQFAAYGLGDTSYDKYNYASKRLHNRLVSLGANAMQKRGDGDIQDKNGYYTTLRPWLAELTYNIRQQKYIEAQKAAKSEDQTQEQKDAKALVDTNIQDDTKAHSDLKAQDVTSKKYAVTIVNTKYLTPADYDKPILQVEMTIDAYKLYYPGDCIGICPANYNANEFVVYNNMQSYIAQKKAEIEFVNEIGFANNANTTRYLIDKYFDINFVPDQLVFYQLQKHILQKPHMFAQKILQYKQVCDRLYEIFADYDLYYSYVYKQKKTFFGVIQDFEIAIDLEFLIANVPKIMPRYYTLTKIDNKYYIYVSLVQSKTTKGQKGLCTEYLKLLQPQQTIFVSVEASNLQCNGDKYLFFVTGTGMAMPWSFVNYFTSKEYVIYYGFRHTNVDQLFVDEMKEKQTQNKIAIHNAVSREAAKMYVQDLFAANASTSIEKIDDYTIFVCGNTNLTKEIRKVLQATYDRQIAFQSETW